MSKADIGVIGLGVMGANLALNIADRGYRVAVFNRTQEVTRDFHAGAGPLRDRIIPCDTLGDFVQAIEAPRPVIIMIKAGEPVDQQIAALMPLVDANDIVIDAGNANFRDTMRRFDKLASTGIEYVGMGVSGGEEGARHGPSIMVGGAQGSWDRISDIVTAIAAKFDGEPCAARVGENGAGHFVKTIHNGIEYADMQMIAETYSIMRDGLGLEADAMAEIFAGWNDGPLDSFLIEITGKVLAAKDIHSGAPIVDMILDAAGQKGTGRWSAIESLDIGVPAPAIEAAVGARSLSSMVEVRGKAEAVLGVPVIKGLGNSAEMVPELEQALLAGKIAAYAQGFAVMAAASEQYGWNLPLAEIARIWRAGCIIRSRFLDEIASAFTAAPEGENLVLTPAFSKMLADCEGSLRKVVAEAVLNGLPVPALSSAIAYFDQLRRARGSANLIQAQRDFFGAHGFLRLDGGADSHGPWHERG